MVAERVSRRVAIVVLLSACQPTASVGSDGTGSSAGSGDTSTVDTTTATSTGAAATTSLPMGSSSGATSVGASSGDSGNPDASTICMELLGGDADCTPGDGDSACDVCLKLRCCAALMQCPSYEACYCTVTCTNGGIDAATCMQSCGETEAGCDLTGCGVDECAQVCAL